MQIHIHTRAQQAESIKIFTLEILEQIIQIFLKNDFNLEHWGHHKYIVRILLKVLNILKQYKTQ